MSVEVEIVTMLMTTGGGNMFRAVFYKMILKIVKWHHNGGLHCPVGRRLMSYSET